MLQKEFKENLIKSIIELGVNNTNNVKFVVEPVVEEGKKLNSTDDWMRLGPINKENLGNHQFSIEEAVELLSAPDSRYPLWVTVELMENKDGKYIIKLRTSRRFRVPSVLQNTDTGHPPFKAVQG